MQMQAFSKPNPLPGRSCLLAEMRGLEELRKFQPQHGLRIPTVIRSSEDELVLERIKIAPAKPGDWVLLAKGLAALHRLTNPVYGFDQDGWIGFNPQVNTPNENWGEFFFKNRLMFQVENLQDPARREEFQNRLLKFESKLITWLNAHRPLASLVHGDLWSGNVIFDRQGPWLIDPAVYYGDREVDIAMTKMFGGFPSLFYDAYQDFYPMAEGYLDREIIYNLYHYLNHLNLFGDSYLPGVASALNKLSSL
jgi:fructosamine-3-kinase